MRRGAALRVMVAAGVVAAASAACSSAPSLHVSTPTAVRFDDSRGVVVNDARPGRPVTLEATVEDGRHRVWRSTATFTADPHGRVDTTSQAPTRGSYTGVHPTGLEATVARKGDTAYASVRGRIDVTYRAVQDGRSAGSVQQSRDLLTDTTASRVSLADAGFEGVLEMPAHAAAGATSVVVLGGSEGGFPLLQAEGLAEAGHPALAVAYFGAPGLPAHLQDIPVETVGTALRYLERQPGIDPHRVVVAGGSRGSELAQLTALHYPDLVAGVAVLSPANQVHMGLPSGNAWTWHGHPVTVLTIPVRRITAPMLMVCGTDDQLWPSCMASQSIVAASPGRSRTVLTEQGAGHYVDVLVPGFPLPSGTVGLEVVGGTIAADALGRLDAWPRTLAWLDHVPPLPG